MAAAGEGSASRAQELWDDEVARLLEAAATLEHAARSAVRAVLCALARDPTADAAGLHDVGMMLAALAQPSSSGQATPAAGPAHPVEVAQLASSTA
jgi:hypothetical protein